MTRVLEAFLRAEAEYFYSARRSVSVGVSREKGRVAWEFEGYAQVHSKARVAEPVRYHYVPSSRRAFGSNPSRCTPHPGPLTPPPPRSSTRISSSPLPHDFRVDRPSHLPWPQSGGYRPSPRSGSPQPTSTGSENGPLAAPLP